jgi:hypothetical protein
MIEFTLVLFILLAIVSTIFIPFAFIWAVNTLFPALAIDYSFINWIAVCVIHMFFQYKVSYKR